MERPLLALVAIVKDEEKSIARTIQSVRGVCDHWTILDTGSTDHTVNILTRESATRDRIVFGPFNDYASARNRAIEAELERDNLDGVEPAARFMLSLSADETLRGGDQLRAFLSSYTGDESAFLVELRTPSGSILYPRVLRARSPWRYVGEIHEEPRYSEDSTRKPTLKIPGCWIDYEQSDPERHVQRLREQDLPGLAKQLAGEKEKTDRERLLFLLAQTHLLLSTAILNSPDGDNESRLIAATQHQCAALGYYLIVAHSDTSTKEQNTYARFKLLNVVEILGFYDASEMLKRLKGVAIEDPQNPAVAYMVASYTASMDARAGLQAAIRAVEIARAAVQNPNNPHDPHGLLWRPHLIAAMCCKAIGNQSEMKKHAVAGIESGGPQEVFQQFIQ